MLAENLPCAGGEAVAQVAQEAVVATGGPAPGEQAVGAEALPFVAASADGGSSTSGVVVLGLQP